MALDKATVLKLIKKEPAPVDFAHVEIERGATAQIILPEGMTYDDAILWIRKKKQEEERDVNFIREINCHPHDGAVALAYVLKDLFGWRELVPERTWFGEILPTFLAIKTGVNEQVTVPWGQFAIPGVKGVIKTAQKGGYNKEKEEYEPEQFVMTGTVWQRDIPILNYIADQVDRRVAKSSIYRGKAIDSRRQFIDLTKVDEGDLVFGPDTMAQIVTSIFTPIEKSDLCRQVGIPLKRGVLFEGPFGTGKTMTAYVTAKKAVESGWSFVYGHTDDEIPQVIHLARQYKPAVVFVEDVDAHLSGDDEADLLDVMDGILSKGEEVIVIYTTNHADKLPQALRRPGRLDAVIHVGPPEPEAIDRLIRKYSRGLVQADEDISSAVKSCKGMIPATIRELVERSKLAAIARTGSTEFSVTDQDLSTTVGLMRRQMDYMSEDRPKGQKVEILAQYQLEPDAVKAVEADISKK